MSIICQKVHPMSVPVHNKICDDHFGGCIKVTVWGKHQDDFSDVRKKPELLDVIAQHAQEYDIERIFVPKASLCSAQITSRAYHFPVWVTGKKPNFLFGAPVDGVNLKPREALFLATGDCPTVVMRHVRTGDVIAFHAGRKSLLDHDFISGKSDNRRVGVVEHASEMFMRGARSEICTGVFLGIGPRNFEHRSDDTVHGTFNKQMIQHVCEIWGGRCFAQPAKIVEESGRTVMLPRRDDVELCSRGQLDLFALIRAQAVHVGIPGVQVVSDKICTFVDGGAAYDYHWHSHARWVRDGKRGLDCRNGVLVMRIE